MAGIMLIRLVVAAILLAVQSGSGSGLYDRLADGRTSPYRIDGRGFATDASHPKHPGDFFRAEIRVHLSVDPGPGEAVLEIESGDTIKPNVDRYYFRRGRLFQTDSIGKEIAATPVGDVSVGAVAALYPQLVAAAMRENWGNVRKESDGPFLFAWNNDLWTVNMDTLTGEIQSLNRNGFHDLFGDVVEQVTYLKPDGVTVTLRGREICNISFGQAVPVDSVAISKGDPGRDRSEILTPGEISITEAAPHLFTIDLKSLNSRVGVAEFKDFLMVIEGAYSSYNCDLIADKIQERFHKPVKYFAFSHLHGQYLAGTRSWAAVGATVLVPPSTAPLIDTVVNASFANRPDRLSHNPVAVKIDTIGSKRKIGDGTNAVEIYNVESQHTDEYFIFYFPKQKALFTGDLLFYRPGKPLTGRSKHLSETVAKLKLDVDKYYCTWPLDGYGTRNVVTREDVAAGTSGK
jgi:glyoxylase-like metal-dependent hydrolase (beta-lactamase superfamily II)